jgi:hypothetical protein
MSSCNFNRGEAEDFLQFIDPTTDQFTFQTFDDSPERREHLAKTIHGSLGQHWDLLCEYSNNGAGIYVTVNRTDLRGRKCENIIAVRALFVDGDKIPIERLAILRAIIPHWVQQTSAFDPSRGPKSDENRDKWHAFWRVDGVSVDEFKGYQQRLAELLGSDRAVCDPPRVMRLPGFPNRKRDPGYLVRRVKCPPAPKDVYTKEEFVRALEQAETKAATLSVTEEQAADGRAEYSQELEEEIYDAAAYLHKKTGALDNYDEWFKQGLGVARLGWDADGRGRALFHRISSLSSKYDSSVCDKKWEDAQKAQIHEYSTTYITNLRRAQKAGWRPKADAALALSEEHSDVIDKLNSQYAYLSRPGMIWRFKHDDMIRVDQFHHELANVRVDGTKPASRAWMTSPRRREHVDTIFLPGQPAITSDNCININQFRNIPTF